MEENEKPQEALGMEEIEAMLLAKQRIESKFPKKIKVDGHTYTVRQISKGIRRRIHALEIEAYALSEERKGEMKASRAKKIQRKLDRLHAKTAAYYLLGNRAVLVPGLFALTWRRLMMRPEKHTAMINDAAFNDLEINFSSANWDITKFQLALSMRPIGEGVREMLKRKESASHQVKEDATKKKEEAEASDPSLKKARKMRK